MLVIFDGDCRLCGACLDWLQRKCEVSAQAFQNTDLSKYGLTREQCPQEVFVIDDGTVYSGALAVALLLEKRGNRLRARIIRGSGALGKCGYRWVAGHRNSRLVRFFTAWLEKANATN